MIEPRSVLEGFTVTINTTETCNLRCKYCYETSKCAKTIKFDTCKKFIDLILKNEDPVGFDIHGDNFIKGIYDNALIIDLIGGDAFMNPSLLNNIIKYTIGKLYSGDPNLSSHCDNWRDCTRFSISTNGTLFKNKEVRDLCEKWNNYMSVGVSIDGCPELHDLNRVYPDGRGSMKDIMKYWEWYKTTFPIDSQGTKSTLSKQSIPYIYDSLKFMYEELGINYINQNFVMEDVGYDDEDIIEFNKQMEKCVEYVLDHRNNLYWSMIDKSFEEAHAPENIDNPNSDWNTRGWCGSGMMPACSVDGDIYPCFRWLPLSQNKNFDYSPFIVGNVDKGITNKDAFYLVRNGSLRCNCTKKEECKTCECESACAYCIAGCFSEFGKFKRTTHTCNLIKSQVKWAKEYWKEYRRLENE